ncbi:MAG: GNAT family N-acetyltransferase [Deltaproteobacteria bacterium]|nr:GNAT family N-acetyltransferase [Deltaproteobacteria bacterium]
MISRERNKRKGITFHFEAPGDIAPATLDQVQALVRKGGAVGASFVRENLRNAFLIGYAQDPEDRVIGTVILKNQKDHYRRRIESATGLDLSGYLERGYTAVTPEWRGRGVAGELIRGLIERSRDQKVYVTIHLDNGPALRLTRKNGMTLAGRFFNQRTGREIGVFINR